MLEYDGITGAFMSVFASDSGLTNPSGLVFGPDGDLYVSSLGSGQVLPYNGTTGAFKSIFASGGGLSTPRGLLFGAAGDLYVASGNVTTV